MINVDYFSQSWLQGDNSDFRILSMVVVLCWHGLKARNIQIQNVHFVTKTLKKTWLNFFQVFFTQFIKKMFESQDTFIKTCLVVQHFIFQPCYSIAPRWRWHIYLGHHQIWAQTKKFVIGSARHSWHNLLVITGLLSDSGWTHPQWREG